MASTVLHSRKDEVLAKLYNLRSQWESFVETADTPLMESSIFQKVAMALRYIEPSTPLSESILKQDESILNMYKPFTRFNMNRFFPMNLKDSINSAIREYFRQVMENSGFIENILAKVHKNKTTDFRSLELDYLLFQPKAKLVSEIMKVSFGLQVQDSPSRYASHNVSRGCTWDFSTTILDVGRMILGWIYETDVKLTNHIIVIIKDVVISSVAQIWPEFDQSIKDCRSLDSCSIECCRALCTDEDYVEEIVFGLQLGTVVCGLLQPQLDNAKPDIIDIANRTLTLMDGQVSTIIGRKLLFILI